MFKFDFLSDDSLDALSSVERCKWKESNEIKLREAHISENILKSNPNINVFKYKNNQEIVEIKYISSEFILNFMKKETLLENVVLEAEKQHSDLIAGVYEGGLKIWECTSDLLKFLIENKIGFEHKKVLDLGCGSGLLGILALFKGSDSVTFQDYNSEVLEYVTIPNVILNKKLELDQTNIKFFSGDWDSFLKITEKEIPSEDEKFDFILTSETIYNPVNYKKLHTVFKERLKPNGNIYLAAKTYYFGIGGGIRDFLNTIDSEGIFTTSKCWENIEGVGRQIILLKFK